MLNTVMNCIAIRPCEESNPNAIHWGKFRDERWTVSTMGCKGLMKTLSELMSWEDGDKYRFSGRLISEGDDKLLLFEMESPQITRTVEQVIVPEKAEDKSESEPTEDAQEELVITETVRVRPASWTMRATQATSTTRRTTPSSTSSRPWRRPISSPRRRL